MSDFETATVILRIFTHPWRKNLPLPLTHGGLPDPGYPITE